MKIFCYFVEPASYTIDLANNIYEKKNIDYCFINSTTLVPSKINTQKDFLDNLGFISRLVYVYNIFRKYDFIIINGYNNYPFLLSFIFNLFSFKKKYIAIESDTQLSVPANILKRFCKWVYLSIIFNHNYIFGFAAGNFSHKDLFRSYGMKEERIFLMPLMVDNQRFYCHNKEFSDIFTFLYIGRLVKHKGVEELINIFNSHFIGKKAVLRIVGGGKEADYLNKRYASDQIIFAGKKSNHELIHELHSASCFVCPSLFEPWGLVVNEALSAALPVICTKHVGASSDLILGKNTGFISCDMNDFGNKMLTLYNDPMLLREFSKNANFMMLDNWNYDLYSNCLDDFIEIIKR